MMRFRIVVRRTPRHFESSVGISVCSDRKGFVVDMRMLAVLNQALVPTTPKREVLYDLRFPIQPRSAAESDGVHGTPPLAHTGLCPAPLVTRRAPSGTDVHWTVGAVAWTRRTRTARTDA